MSHLRIVDTHASRGLAICEFRQDVHGDVYVIKGLVLGRDQFVYIVGIDQRFGLMRALTLVRVGPNDRLLNGIVSGVEPAGPSFAARMMVVRVDGDFDEHRGDTGHFDDVDAAEAIVARHIGVQDLLARRRITGGAGSYLDASPDA